MDFNGEHYGITFAPEEYCTTTTPPSRRGAPEPTLPHYLKGRAFEVSFLP